MNLSTTTRKYGYGDSEFVIVLQSLLEIVYGNCYNHCIMLSFHFPANIYIFIIVLNYQIYLLQCPTVIVPSIGNQSFTAKGCIPEVKALYPY